MTKDLVNELVLQGQFPQSDRFVELLETHISWVIICDRYVYKIKRPIQYSFLDFSTLKKRKFYCEREVVLNQRLTDNIYLDILPIRKHENNLTIGGEHGETVDYAVRMRKVDRTRQMDVLLTNNNISDFDLLKLAEKMADFHSTTEIIFRKNILDVQEKFVDLEAEKSFLDEQLPGDSCAIIAYAINVSQQFIDTSKELLASRLNDGLFRDCHGDLHSRNIFLLSSPQPFDCIEFNDDLRQIDILNEIAFLCMDLEAFGRHDLSDLFLKYYNGKFPCIKTDEEQRLFTYYKSYRANIRAKVNSLRARSAFNNREKVVALAETGKYLHLMNGYLKELESIF